MKTIRILLVLLTSFLGVNVQGAKLTINVEGPGYVELGDIQYKNTTTVVDYDPEEDLIVTFSAVCTKTSDVEITSEGVSYWLNSNYNVDFLEGEIPASKEYLCAVNTEEVWYDCSVTVRFKKIDLSEYVSITVGSSTLVDCNSFATIRGDILVNGIHTEEFLYNSYYSYINVEMYAKKGSTLKISAYDGQDWYEGFYEVHLTVNEIEYEDLVCVIQEVNEPIDVDVWLVSIEESRITAFCVNSEGPGTTQLLEDNNIMFEWHGDDHSEFDYDVFGGRFQVKAIPDDGNKIIGFSSDEKDYLKQKILADGNYHSGDAITVDSDYAIENYSVKYGPMNTPFVLADDKEIIYGDEPGSLTWHVKEGSVNGEPVLNTPYIKSSRTGKYPIYIKKGTLDKDCILFSGTITVKKAQLVCKPKDITITQGDKMPEIHIEYDGFKNTDDARCLWAEPIASTVEKTMEPGIYDITLSGGYSHEYDFVFQTGKLTILPNEGVVNFADSKVKEICLSAWDSNRNGMLEIEEAGAVSSLGTKFKGNKVITSFDELKYFTGVKELTASSFLNCTSLQNVTLPASVKTIGQNALSGCLAMTRIDVDEENEWFKSVDGVLFSKDGSSLVQFPVSKTTEYIVPNGTVTICRDAFYHNNLTSVTLPSTVRTLDYDAFGYSIHLTSIILPEGLETISDYAFDHCVYLESVTIPSTVASIGQKVFNYCKILKDVNAYMLSPTDINENNFPSEVYTNATLHVPAGTEAAYTNAGGWKKFKTIKDDLFYVDPNMVLSVAEMSVRPGGTCNLIVDLQNGGTILNGYQFDLELPEGFSLEKNEKGNFVYELSDRYSDTDAMQVNIRELSSRVYRVLCISMSNETITGTDGPIIILNLTASDNIGDSSTGWVRAISLSAANGRSVLLDDAEFSISKIVYAPGDANGDGSVNVADVMLIVNHILGNTLPVFHEECANMNGDNRIDVADVMLVVNMILSGEAQAPAIAQFETSGLDAVSTSDNKVELHMGNMNLYTAFQMQVKMSPDVRLLGAEMAEETTGHRVVTKEIGDGLYNVIVYSLNGENFKETSDGTLLRLLTSGSSKSLEIENIQFTNPSFETITFSNVTGITGIEDVSSEETDEIYYNLQGMPVKNPTHGIFLQRGKKKVINK